MLVFALVQVWFMFWQNRQPLQLKRLDLVQQLDEVAFEFDGSRESAIKIQEWLVKHQSVCALLLKKKATKAVERLFEYLMDIRRGMDPIDTQTAIERVKKFNDLVTEVVRRLGTAGYGFTQENMQKEKKIVEF